ncbi:homoserine O- acetyltransferase [Thoreauomyces humboldtii]|nr:homoserine O- acetyltransferase [Thoreauomyces humboldtii]
MQALLTYRSRNSFESRFGRKVMPTSPTAPQELPRSASETASIHHNEGHKTAVSPTSKNDASAASTSASDTLPGTAPKVYSAQSYLRYQGDKFIRRFDANCYISITRKMDTHDVSRARGEYYEVLGNILQPALVIGIETDGLFTIGEQRELADHIPNARLEVIESSEGHDGFLLEFERINALITAFVREHVPDLFLGRTMDAVGSESFANPKTSVFGEAEDALMW